LDFTLYKAINGFAYGHDRFEDALRFFALDAQFFFVAPQAVLFLARGKWTSRNARHGVIAAGLAVALALAIARVAVGTHYPSDVVGGALLGTAAALMLWLPPIRGRLHLLADWAGALYERIASWALRLPSRAPG
jgi:hypothetical protein